MSSDWRAYLKPSEAEELTRLEAVERQAVVLRRTLYERCRKRMQRASAKEKAA